jgi:hypothetical protein
MDISTLFTQAARKWPQALAIKDLRGAVELSFAELDQALDDFAAGLVELGVGYRRAGCPVGRYQPGLSAGRLRLHGPRPGPRAAGPSLAPGELLAQIRMPARVCCCSAMAMLTWQLHW